jgi:hypothetical protein
MINHKKLEKSMKRTLEALETESNKRHQFRDNKTKWRIDLGVYGGKRK